MQHKSSVAAVGDTCDACDQIMYGLSYCSSCACTFCDRCWDRQAPHKPGRVGSNGFPHEKTDKGLVMKIQAALDPGYTAEIRQQLHWGDMDSAWLGVSRGTDGKPVLEDYGRYAALIASIAESAGQPPTPPTELFPGLATFIGQTGAGKSALVKLLIDLSAEPEERFPTPVVGDSGSSIPTSQGINLYVHPQSITSARPTLLADCEGFEGGDREPAAVRAKALEPKSGKRRTLQWATTRDTKSRAYLASKLYSHLVHTLSDVIVYVLKNPK